MTHHIHITHIHMFALNKNCDTLIEHESLRAAVLQCVAVCCSALQCVAFALN